VSDVKIEFVRTGGFAAIRLTTSIDSEKLPPAEASKIETLVESAGFFDLLAEIRPSAPAPDRFEYRLTVSTAGRTHTIVMSEAAIPASVGPLIDYLTAAAKTGGGR
jgi:hypothetical protein